MQWILASQSPRRRELFSLFHLPFTVKVADVDETLSQTASAYAEVARLSRQKADAIARSSDDVVIAADTVVVCDGVILGKPKDEQEAVEMLTLLSGRDHEVMTGVTVLYGEKAETFTEVTQIHFRELSQQEIADYVATGEPMDKAGAYGIQGGGALFAEKMVGDYYNVMGLPVCRLWHSIQKLVPNFREDMQ